MSDRLRDLRGDFYQVENSFIKQHGKNVGVYGIAAYNVIAMHANAKGEDAFPSYKTISEMTGMSVRKAVDAVNQLVGIGVLLRESRFTDKGQTSNIYTLVPVPYARGAQPYAQDAPPPMHVVHPPHARGAYDQDPFNKIPLDQKKEDPPSPLPTKTGDPLMDVSARKFGKRGKAMQSSWQAELNMELEAKKRIPLANRLAEIWKMTRSIDAGNDSALRKCHEVAVRLYSMGVQTPAVLDVHYSAYVADDWRRKNNPSPTPETLEKFISQSIDNVAERVTIPVGISGELGFDMKALAGGVL